MKNRIAPTITGALCTLCLSICGFLAPTAYGSDGIPITSCEDFMSKMKEAPTGSFYLTQDIDCEGKVFTALASFNGVLDGQFHSVKNFIVIKYKDGAMCCFKHGMFLRFGDKNPDAVIKNIALEGIEMGGDGDVGAGTIASFMAGGTIQNVKVNTAMNGGYPQATIGGMVGVMKGGRILDSEVSVKFTRLLMYPNVGGIAGRIDGPEAIVKNVRVKNIETAENNTARVGGVAAVISGGAIVSDVQVYSGNINGLFVGGAFGEMGQADVSHIEIADNVVIAGPRDSNRGAGGGIIGTLTCGGRISSSQSNASLSSCVINPQNSALGMLDCADTRPAMQPVVIDVTYDGTISQCAAKD